jgi:FkbM family methyltransferase
MRLELVRSPSPTRDFARFVGHLRALGLEPRTVIDVGVAFGTPSLYASLPHAKFFLVEPVPGCRPLLARLEREIGATCFAVAAGSTDGEMEFHVHDDVSGSSAYRQWEGEALDGTTVTVPVRRLDGLVPGDVQRPLLLKIDTQGAELEVIEGAERLLANVDIAIVECSFHQFRKGAPELNEVVAAMARRGFRCYEVLEGHFRSLDGAMAQVDIAFVPEGSPLRRERGFFSPEQAANYARSASRTAPDA